MIVFPAGIISGKLASISWHNANTAHLYGGYAAINYSADDAWHGLSGLFNGATSKLIYR